MFLAKSTCSHSLQSYHNDVLIISGVKEREMVILRIGFIYNKKIYIHIHSIVDLLSLFHSLQT